MQSSSELPDSEIQLFLKAVEVLAVTKNKDEYDKASLQIHQCIENNKTNPDLLVAILNTQTKSGDTLFTLATRKRLTNIMDDLLNLNIVSQLINVPNSNGVTPLIGAIMANDNKMDIVERLLKTDGIDVNHISVGKLCDMTALSYAASNGKLNAVVLLLQQNKAVEYWKNHPEDWRIVSRIAKAWHNSNPMHPDEVILAEKYQQIEKLLVTPFQNDLNKKLLYQKMQEKVDFIAKKLERDFYLMPELPDNSLYEEDKKYKNCYVLVNNKDLYYFQHDGNVEAITIKDHAKFLEVLEGVNKDHTDKMHLTHKDISSLIKASGDPNHAIANFHWFEVTQEEKVAHSETPADEKNSKTTVGSLAENPSRSFYADCALPNPEIKDDKTPEQNETTEEQVSNTNKLHH